MKLDVASKAIAAIKEALAEQQQQQTPEHFCWKSPEGTIYQCSDDAVIPGSIPMYLVEAEML